MPAATTAPVLTQPRTFFAGARRSRPVIDAIAAADAPPRAFVVGNAGSGKSTVLRHLYAALADRGIAASMFDHATDVGAVPRAHVLIVDDLHLLDDAALEAVSERSADPGAALVVASRPWPRAAALVRISRRLERSTPPIVLGHVSRSDVLAYLDERDRLISSTCVEHILELTGGVTWLVSEALAIHDERDCDGDHEHSAIRRALEARIAHRLDTLDAPLRAAIEQVCIRPPDGTTALPDESAVADDLIAQGWTEGLLLRSGRPVPLVRTAVRAAMPELYRGALGSGDAAALTERQALAAWTAGDLDAAAGFIDAALAADASGPRDGLADTAAAVWSARGMMATGSDVYSALPPRSPESAARALVVHVGAGAVDAVAPRSSKGSRAAADDRAGAPSTLGVAMRLLAQGLQGSLSNTPPASVLSDVVRASELYTSSRTTVPIAELPAVIAAAVAVGAGDLEAAVAAVEAALEGGQGGGWARPRLLLWHAWLAIESERPAEARDALARALQSATPRSPRDELLLQAVQVTLARRYDDVASLEAAWRAALDGIRHTEVDLYSLLPLSSLIGAGARIGDAETLAGQFDAALALLGRLGDPPLWATHVRWAGIQQGILLNRPDSLSPHARALVDAAPANRVAATMAQAGRVWTSVLAGTVDADAVESAARGLAAAGLAWDGARLAGHGAGRTKDRKAAARLLSCARELHPHDAVRKVPANDDASTAESPAGGMLLSEREHDVALLVLQGKTYAEIGETIFISPRTAEHHIAHIRRRLGATSRSDLIAKLRVAIEQPAERRSTPGDQGSPP